MADVPSEPQEVFGETVDVQEVAIAPYHRPTPHGDKLRELVRNPKLPSVDRPKVLALLEQYDQWLREMAGLASAGDEKVRDLVALLNAYKEKVEVDLIWDSSESFLYRQKGQLKLDNSVLEEWFPWLVDPAIMPELGGNDLVVGPAKAFAAARFQSSLTDVNGRPGLIIRNKDQDFTIGRPVYLKASFSSSFDGVVTDEVSTYVAYIAAELKTNLDKTMFQEASATSHDLTIATPGSHYFLICEYLDMTPISSAGTDISEVLVLRGRRTGSQDRRNYSDAEYRRKNRDEYVARLRKFPVRTEVVERFVSNVRAILQNHTSDLSDAVERGYF
ncbi:Bpu10I restriction endonuclease [Saccharopolyspora kobensis]|uniref:Bpu10I restriction endonuclease n=1 Tax=Saccharopolyspora kobensis TaxID=146035 RepID=A0A1H6CZ66_9PSEU|nr:Bpu10I family restriction endonuclease [Saccharopolyspora kobensis]SEG78439.1 Bpu10I restriction endonuclease [Saccharopolyspora kobensis]SFD05375.1 Bpu10I restriction endonuclease [Saccharopolyspora kobensis]